MTGDDFFVVCCFFVTTCFFVRAGRGQAGLPHRSAGRDLEGVSPESLWSFLGGFLRLVAFFSSGLVGFPLLRLCPLLLLGCGWLGWGFLLPLAF